jgi:hypothetical protein
MCKHSVYQIFKERINNLFAAYVLNIVCVAVIVNTFFYLFLFNYLSLLPQHQQHYLQIFGRVAMDLRPWGKSLQLLGRMHFLCYYSR